jgi:hypothetical protein
VPRELPNEVWSVEIPLWSNKRMNNKAISGEVGFLVFFFFPIEYSRGFQEVEEIFLSLVEVQGDPLCNVLREVKI